MAIRKVEKESKEIWLIGLVLTSCYQFFGIQYCRNWGKYGGWVCRKKNGTILRSLVSRLDLCFRTLFRIGFLFGSVPCVTSTYYRSYIIQNAKATDSKKEFDQQVIEYRATGSYQPSEHFVRLENSSVWIRKDRPSHLEKEISSYETIQFPKRPPQLDKEYRERELRSVLKRKLKLKGLLKEDGKTWKDGVDFEAEFEKERTKRTKQNKKDDCSEIL